MDYDSGGASDDDDEEYEEVGNGNRFLGFMFGNVDNSGDLDVDYLDEDAKEHLAALADKLGPSLADIDLSVKSPKTSGDAAEQDYDEKAEDAVDYEDIEEQYEGPEIQAPGEEDNILPGKEYFSVRAPFATLHDTASVFDDENYDEDEEPGKELEAIDKNVDGQTSVSEVQGASPAVACEGIIPADQVQCRDSPPNESPVVGFEEFQENADIPQQPLDEDVSSPLPVLCVENGLVILRFSEIFGIHEFPKKSFKRDFKSFARKECLTSVDDSDIVEEDEEAFLRGSSQGFSSIKLAQNAQDDTLGITHGDLRFENYMADQDEGRFALRADEDNFLSGGPMKDDLTTDLSVVWQLPQSANFDPLDQQDWENSILWDSSPSIHDNSAEAHDVHRDDLGDLIIGNTELDERLENLKLEHQMARDEMSDGFGCPATSETVRSGNTPGFSKPELSTLKFHPQLLRLESHLEMDNSGHLDGLEEKREEEQLQDDALKKLSKISLQNRHILEGSWVDEIIWEPNVLVTKQKLVLDLQDGRMLFEVLDNKDNRFWLHAGAMVMTRSPIPSSHESLALTTQGSLSGWHFDIANDIFYSNRKSSQQLNTSSEKRIAYGGEVYHSAPALKLETMKLKLSNKDVANFHRPKALWYPYDNELAVKEQGKLSTQGPMKIIIKSLGGKGSKLHVDAEETISSIKIKASKKLDFKLSEPVKIYYRGNELEDHKSLAMQNVQPNSLLHVVRTKVHLLPRAQQIPGENKSLRPPGAFKKKSELSVKDGHVFLMEYCEERPLLLNNIGMGARLCTYYQKIAPSDQNGNFLRSENRSFGTVVALDSSDKSPFLGDIKAGCAQSSLETNLYRAPIFPHKVSSTDYLLVRSAKGKLSLRRIDRINVVGQQEPLMEVMSPGTKDLQSYLMKRVLVYMFRQFRTLKKSGITPYVRADELSSQFPNLSEAFLRNRLRKHACAELKRGANGQWIWKMRPNFHIPSEEALRKLVPPEKVCAYESMQAGLYRLKHLGITRLTNPTGTASAMSQLPNEAIALAAASHIERELQLTPWNLSSNFVACTNQVRENLERLEISGLGDPSGRGLGFSYVRAAPKPPVSSAMTKKKAAAGRGGSTVTGTDADLRRLSMEAAREVLLKFNVPDEIIAKQTRWHRIAMIRELSSEQAASGVKVDPTTISKYARGQRMSFIQLQQQTREKCQEIWDRQVQSLTAIEGDEGASDSESNSDLDSFAGDLENLLDAEECEGDEAIHEHKHDRSDGVKGLKMRRHSSLAEAEEKVEDEAAEAAELCRMLMDDDETELLKKEKKGAVWKEVIPAPVAQPAFDSEKAERVKKPKKVARQVLSSIQPDELKQDTFGDHEDVETLLSKKNFPPKVKAKKVKILGDGMKIFKEKKSARESFVCGACGQLGHMRTNKNCPRYGEDPDSQTEALDPDKASGKSSLPDSSTNPPQKSVAKKIVPKSATKIAFVEATEGEKISSKAKVQALKIKSGSVEKPSDSVVLGTANTSDQPASSTVDPGSNPATKVNKIVISSKTKPGDVPLESHKPSIRIRPLADTDRGHSEVQKTSIVFRPPADTDRTPIEPHRPSIVIRPPADIEKEQTRKKLIIKRTKEVVDLDQVSLEGSADFEYRKTKKIVELSDFERHRKQESTYFTESSSKKKSREDRWWEEEEKRRKMERLREEKTRRMEEMRMLEERERLAEIERYEVSLRREREEEARLKANKKKKKMKRPKARDEYPEDYTGRRNDKRMPERDRTAKRKPLVDSGKVLSDYAPSTKRRRGGEVGLANILERIVETLRSRQEVSYLFLKPVTKKEAPDYLDIIDKPMDLSTIREKVRRMEYKNREDFRHDVWQITFNAHKYNDGRNPGIPPLADQLLELCDFLLMENDESLTEAEEGIEY